MKKIRLDNKTVKLGENYTIVCSSESGRVIATRDAKFIKVSRKGYNFLRQDNYKCIFPNHFYPKQENVTKDGIKITFVVGGLEIQESKPKPLKKPKEVEKMVCDRVCEFIDENWDKIKRKSVGIVDDKKIYLDKVAKDIQESMWIIYESCTWGMGMDEPYFRKLFAGLNDNTDGKNFEIMKIADTYIKVEQNRSSGAYGVSEIEPKFKKILYFDHDEN